MHQIPGVAIIGRTEQEVGAVGIQSAGLRVAVYGIGGHPQVAVGVFAQSAPGLGGYYDTGTGTDQHVGPIEFHWLCDAFRMLRVDTVDQPCGVADAGIKLVGAIEGILPEHTVGDRLGEFHIQKVKF